jgi:serine/threonine protein kinase
MSAEEGYKERLIETSAELRALPKTWTFTIGKDVDRRVMFQKKDEREQTYYHPTLGALPKPWILRLQKDKKTGVSSIIYYNRQTQRNSTQDPRYLKEYLDSQPTSVSKALSIGASVIVNSRKFDISTYARSPIKNHNIRNQFMIAHTIDDGGGTLGGMNGGVFVVRMHGNPSRMFVEKRFKSAPEDIEMARDEIEMLHKVKHSSLTFYIDAFVTTNPLAASVYCEFCDRGSLQDIIRVYGKFENQQNRPMVPEAFAWHAFIGLCDGLAYLQGGVSFLNNKHAVKDPNWCPVLHRDMKPDNVLMRSRATLGSGKYFYCVLSDFGLACEDRPNDDPQVNYHQKAGLKLGTSAYWAPELLYNPYPRTDGMEGRKYPDGARHSARSDLWALGASLFNLCAGDYSHMDFSQKPAKLDWQVFTGGVAFRVQNLVLPKTYSKSLQKSITLATMWNPKQRPSPIAMIVHLETLLAESGFSEQGGNDPLPDWATRVHEYHHSAEKVERQELAKTSQRR